MKLPQVSLRELFLLLLVVAGLCWGWSESRRRAAIRAELDALIRAERTEVRLKCSEGDFNQLLHAIVDNLEEHHLMLSDDSRGWVVEKRRPVDPPVRISN